MVKNRLYLFLHFGYMGTLLKSIFYSYDVSPIITQKNRKLKVKTNSYDLVFGMYFVLPTQKEVILCNEYI